MPEAVRNPVPPRLPDPENDYSPRFIAALLQTLRLYFSQLSGALGAVIGDDGGRFLQFPFGNFASTASQNIASTTTAYAITFDTPLAGSGVTLSAGTKLTVEREGVYRVSVIAQLANPDTQIRQASIWFRKNGTDLVDSRGEYSVISSHGGIDGYIAVEQARVLTLQAGDYIEFFWCAESTTVHLQALPVGTLPTRPASPSALAKVTYLSRL